MVRFGVQQALLTRLINSLCRTVSLVGRAGVLAVWLLPAPPAAAASKGSSGKNAKVEEAFKPFAIISQRNLFNASRGLTPPPVPAAPRPPRPPQIEAFALLGTMSSERGAVAFFDGTSAVYRKAAQAGEKLGDYPVLAVERDCVKLQVGDHELCLPLKMQFRREDQGNWQLAELPDDFQPTSPPPRSTLTMNTSGPHVPSREEVRDYVASKYQRKLEQYANDPARAAKLLRSIDGEIESRLRKLAKPQRK